MLRYWGVLSEGRAPSIADTKAALPALLALWDHGADKVSGAWLHARGIDPKLLTDIGFLVLAGWEGDDLIDDEDQIGQVAAEVVPRPEGIELTATEGQSGAGGPPDRYRVYRVREGWVVQHLRERVIGVLDAPAVKELNPYILFLGSLEIDGRDVLVYLVRGLADDGVRASVDTELRARPDQGIGLVLQAGNVAGACLAANVLTPVLDHIDDSATDILLAASSLRSVFRSNRALAQGGQTVHLERTGNNAGRLFVPGKGSIDIIGENRLRVIERLVRAHNGGPAPMATGDIVKGIAEDHELPPENRTLTEATI